MILARITKKVIKMPLKESRKGKRKGKRSVQENRKCTTVQLAVQNQPELRVCKETVQTATIM